MAAELFSAKFTDHNGNMCFRIRGDFIERYYFDITQEKFDELAKIYTTLEYINAFPEIVYIEHIGNKHMKIVSKMCTFLGSSELLSSAYETSLNTLKKKIATVGYFFKTPPKLNSGDLCKNNSCFVLFNVDLLCQQPTCAEDEETFAGQFDLDIASYMGALMIKSESIIGDFKKTQLDMTEQDAFDAVVNHDEALMNTICVHPRVLINHFKNDLESLEFLLAYLENNDCIPQSGSYMFEGVEDLKTFDLYRRFGIDDLDLEEQLVSPEQWLYLLKLYDNLNEF